jgi:hypothetical protein
VLSLRLADLWKLGVADSTKTQPGTEKAANITDHNMTYTATTSRSQDLSAPRSPTLSISMVHEAERNVSPPPYMSPAFHRAPPLVQTRKQPSAQSSRSTLRTAMGDARAVNNHAREELLASSPTINGLNSPQNWTPKMAERRSSVASSLLSEDFENWPGFEGHDKFDDSGLGMEEQESRDQFPGDTDTREEMETERWLSRHSSGSDESDDPYSSAALSRRAEIILANAKKRLNVGATVSRETIGRLLTATGHGREPPWCPRVTCRLSHL